NDNVIRWNAMDALLPRVSTRTAEAQAQRGQRQQVAQAQRTGARGQQQQQAAQRTGRAQLLQIDPAMQRRGAAREPIIPIFKLMSPTRLPTMILKY
ncbi:MAG: hypothetical protein AMJ79_10425, partial [Phycisphaerae bacterium SM23_30]